MTVESVSASLVDDAKFNQAVAPTNVEGAVVETLPPSASGARQVDVFDANGDPQATALVNANGSASVMSYNSQGEAADGTSVTSTGITAQAIADQSNGSQLYSNFTTNTNGSTTDDQQGLAQNGTLQYEQVTTTQTNGAVSATISGQGDVADLNNATITAGSGVQATINGQNDQINLAGSNDKITVNGSNDTVTGNPAGANIVTFDGEGGTGRIGLELPNGGDVVNSGSIVGGEYGIYAPSGATTVSNLGTITGTNGAGILIGGAGTITNNGVISGANGVSIGQVGTVTNTKTITATNGTAVSIGDGGSLTNAAGQSITGTAGGVEITGAAGTVTNNGTIKASASSGIGLELGDGGKATNATGATISGGEYGIYAPSGATDIANSGTIEGLTGIEFGGTGGTLTTAGKIIGTGGVAVELGSGNKLVIEAGASFVGKVLDSNESDILELAKGTGQILGLGSSIAGFGVVDIDAGGYWQATAGGSIDELLLDGSLGVTEGASLNVQTMERESSGAISLEANATLDIGEAIGSHELVKFSGANSSLEIDHAQLFGVGATAAAYSGPILQDFSHGDSVDLKGLSPIGLQLVVNGGFVDIERQGIVQASLSFASPDYAGAAFHLGADGHG